MREGQPGIRSGMSVDLFDQLILSLPYFDREGFFLALDENDQLLGFAHAGFGPNDGETDISYETGTIPLILLRPQMNENPTEVGGELLNACETYLMRKGARAVFGGSFHPVNPFYLGLYGGSDLPGVLSDDETVMSLYRNNGYMEVERITLMRMYITGFIAPIDRDQMRIRRTCTVQSYADPDPGTWWRACVWGNHRLLRYELRLRNDTRLLALADFRYLEPVSQASVTTAIGLCHLHVAPEMRNQGYGLFLLSEAFRQFVRQGTQLVEAQMFGNNAFAQKLFRKIGFVTSGKGTLFRKMHVE